MHDRRIPEWLRHAPAPSLRGFALLAGTEAIARGILVSVFPVVMYNALNDARLVSEVYFAIGAVSLVIGLLVPTLIRFVPRWWVFVFGAALFVGGAIAASFETAGATVAGLAMTTFAVVITFVCFNAYVLDHVAKLELGRFETSRLFYSALGWTVGPALGTFLYQRWPPAPFLIAAAAAFAMLVMFRWPEAVGAVPPGEQPRRGRGASGVLGSGAEAASAPRRRAGRSGIRRGPRALFSVSSNSACGSLS
jgi:ACDE family multidrug resistance protein